MFYTTAKKIFKANKLITIPASKNRKGPFIKDWSKYSKKAPTKTEFKSWLENYSEANICIPLGELNRLVAIDIDFNQEDNPELYGKVMEILPPTPIAKKGQKGLTLFYKFTNEISQSFKFEFEDGNKTALEVLSNGRTTDLPPSTHPKTKKNYQYTTEQTLEISDSVSELPCLSEKIIANLKKLFQSNTAILKNNVTGRNDQIKRMVISSLNKGVEVSVLLNQVLQYDKKHHSNPLFSDPTEFKDISSPDKNAQDFIMSIYKTLNNNTDCSSLKVMNLEELLNTKHPDIDWLVSDLLPSAGTSLLIAGPKMCKSQLSRYLAFAVADGKKFLKRDVKQGKVLIVLLEEHSRNIVSQLALLNIKNFSNVSFIERKNSQNYFLDTLKHIEKHRPSLVIIDTLAKFFGVDDINNYSKVIGPMNQIETIAHSSNTHILMIHHSRKGGTGSTEDVLGSTGLFSSVDTLLMIHNSQGAKDKIFITSKQRYSNIDFNSNLLIRNDKNLNFSEFSSLEEFNEFKTENNIKRLLKEKSLTETDIIDNVKGKTSIIKNSLFSLYDKGKISRTGKGIKGNPYFYSIP